MNRSYPSAAAAATDLLRHVPPCDIEERMFNILDLNEEVTDDLLSTTDLPLKLEMDTTVNRNFIKCDYNRDGNGYRSPFSNKYFPDVPDGVLPPPHLKRLEAMANQGFQAYLRLYFESGDLSVYTWELDESSFGIGIFVLKNLDTTLRDGAAIKGSISCSDVITVTQTGKDSYTYNCVSSILLECEQGTRLGEPIKLSGGCSDQFEKSAKAADDLTHLINIGTLVEENAANFIERVRSIYVGKMSEILAKTKGVPAAVDPRHILAASLKAVAKH